MTTIFIGLLLCIAGIVMLGLGQDALRQAKTNRLAAEKILRDALTIKDQARQLLNEARQERLR